MSDKASDYTITAALELYCDRQSMRNLIQSVYALGAIFGLLLVNYISDTRGRKIALIITQCVSIASVISRTIKIKLS